MHRQSSPMTRHRPYHPMNPRSGISPAHRTVPDYCYASPLGEDGKRGGILSYRAFAPIGACDVGSRPTANSLSFNGEEVMRLLFLSLFLSLTFLSVHAEKLLCLSRSIETFEESYLSHSDSLIDDGFCKVKFIRAIKIPGGYLLRGFAIQKSHKTRITILSTENPSVNMENGTPLKTNKSYALVVRPYFDNPNQYGASFHYPGTLNILLYDSVLCIPIEEHNVPLYFSPNISGLFFNDKPFMDDLTIDTFGLASTLSSFMSSLVNKNDSVWNYADISCLSDQLNKYQAGTRSAKSSKNGRRIITDWHFHKYGQRLNDTAAILGTIYKFCELDDLSCDPQRRPLLPIKINILYAEGERILIKTEWRICSQTREIIFQVLKEDTCFKIVGLSTPHLIYAQIICD